MYIDIYNNIFPRGFLPFELTKETGKAGASASVLLLAHLLARRRAATLTEPAESGRHGDVL